MAFKCPLCCVENFSSIETLYEHLLHIVQRHYECSICYKSMNGLNAMLQHLKLHINCNDLGIQDAENLEMKTDHFPFDNNPLNMQTNDHDVSLSHLRQIKKSTQFSELRSSELCSSKQDEFQMDGEILCDSERSSKNMSGDILLYQQCERIECNMKSLTDNIIPCDESVQSEGVQDISLNSDETFASCESDLHDAASQEEQREAQDALDLNKEAIRAYVCEVCGSKEVGKDAYFLHVQGSCRKPLSENLKPNYFNKSGCFVSENLDIENGSDLVNVSCSNLSFPAPNAKPYIHKKFDHDLERKCISKNMPEVQTQDLLYLSKILNSSEEICGQSPVPSLEINNENEEEKLHSPSEMVLQEPLPSKKSTERYHNYGCDRCSKVYSDAHVLLRHKNEKHTDDICVCAECGKQFTSMRSLANHRGVHSTKKNSCTKCEYSCFTSSGLRTHIFEMHSKEKKNFVCDKCEISFKKKYALQRHIFRKHEDHPHTCKYCDKGFACKEDLNRHKIMHLNDKSLTCGECEKVFTSYWSLRRHAIIHNSVKEKHFCTKCNSSFSRKDSLLDHMKLIHSLEKPNFCCLCGLAFSCKSHLKKHIVKHRRPQHECRQCGKAYKFKTSLKNHSCQINK